MVTLVASLALTAAVAATPARTAAPPAIRQASPAAATQAPTAEAEEIRRRVRVGQKVSITDDQGRQVEGRISTLSADGLTLVSRRDSTDIPYDRIVRVDRPRDGLGNGAVWGLGVGAASGFLALLAEENRECEPGFFSCGDPEPKHYLVIPLMTGGLGAAIGVGVDALIRREPNIYRRGSGTARLLVRPAFGRGIKAAVVSVSW